jgi:hypothetical protein
MAIPLSDSSALVQGEESDSFPKTISGEPSPCAKNSCISSLLVYFSSVRIGLGLKDHVVPLNQKPVNETGRQEMVYK